MVVEIVKDSIYFQSNVLNNASVFTATISLVQTQWINLLIYKKTKHIKVLFKSTHFLMVVYIIFK